MTTLMANIIDDIRALPPDGLKKAAGYIHILKERSTRRRDAVLKSTATAFSSAEAKAMEKAIEEGCERIDPNAW